MSTSQLRIEWNHCSRKSLNSTLKESAEHTRMPYTYIQSTRTVQHEDVGRGVHLISYITSVTLFKLLYKI